MTDRARQFRFVHCADLHLDSPCEGISEIDPQIAEALRTATFRAFDNVIELALREQVDLLVVAGDVCDGLDQNLRAQLHFGDGLARAAAAGIPSCVAHGSGDPLGSGLIETDRQPEVFRFGAESVDCYSLARQGRPLVDVYGISHAAPAVTDNLARRFRPRGAAPVSIGVLHCRVGTDEHGPAPCSLDDLAAAGIDYWALGHDHQRHVLRAADPAVVYAGTVQGRSVREQGPQGCFLVRVDQAGQFHPEFRATDTVRWFERSIDIGDFDDRDRLLDALAESRETIRAEADGRGAVVRLQLTGRGELHSMLRRDETAGELVAPLHEGEPGRSDFVWIESVRVAGQPVVDVEQRRRVDDFVGDFLRAADAVRGREDAAQTVRRFLSLAAPKSVIPEIDSLSEEALLAILDEAEVMGLDRLLGQEA